MLKKSPNTISPLDGVRALAILFVLCIHSKEMLFQVAGRESFLMTLPPFKGGWIGIPLFFSLSGFLIGIQVWEELKETNDINFKRFFLKRAFRIWPLFYVLFVFFIIFPYQSGVTDYLVNALFLSNFLGDNGPIRASWSLATEEQFYILLPLALSFACYLTRRNNSKLSLSSVRKFLIALFFIPTICRFLTWDYLLHMDHFDLTIYMKYIYRPIITHSEGLIAGLFLATFYVENKIPKVNQKIGWIILISSFVIGLLSFMSKIYFNFLGISIAAIALIWFCLVFDTFISRFLSHPLFSLIAKCSFSMYLINWPILHYLERFNFIRNENLSINAQLILNTGMLILISITVSIFNYKYIEDPFLKIRKRVLNSL